jgi:hypothetical protein
MCTCSAGKPLSLPQDVRDALEQALRQPAGVASDDALRQWVQQTQHREVDDPTLDPRMSARSGDRPIIPS